MDDMMCWSMTHIQMCRYFIHCYAAIFLHDGFNYCNVLWCHYWVCLTGSRGVCYRTNGVHELPIPLAHFLQWQTWSPYWTFIRPWISMGFTPSLLTKRITERCSSLVYVASGVTITTAPSCCIPASHCHLSATHQTVSIIVLNLLGNRAVFRIFIALLRFSFDSPSYTKWVMLQCGNDFTYFPQYAPIQCLQYTTQ